ncbi:L-2-hydroxyglutarate oxidase LhgO [Rubripirellula lacrimiformis]|uniref:L-2-hydroxyglutarate oxidase LhgO n=1 Tax=Rubripirellula lacrimiformis TaxID=1930273 RepID=A0A517NAE1_9BACT|nr:L-2-hydroxyglutarate oxidase [Rubripirellula lacrimiformis]QDT04101.1 L-2-hydroxyglutarate oxidase LhgO [Rubripirellula lacrimiformis]
MPQHHDIIIIGGGIVGLATAMRLCQRFSDQRVLVVEAEQDVGQHQSGHNSGVLHSGIYYRPDSEKARMCLIGKAAMESFCDQHQIAWDRCGKVIVATTPNELNRLDSIAQRGVQNKVPHQRIDTDDLRLMEPNVAGLAALHVPGTGIVNYGKVCQVMRDVICRSGGELRVGFSVQQIIRVGQSLTLKSRSGDTVQAARMINCGGLRSDRIFEMAGGTRTVRIVPFRGEYYDLVAGRESLCRNLIYPVPDPSFPFLGVHFTRMIDGGVECGPNAVLALSRSGYRWRDVHLGDMIDSIAFRGFRSLAKRHWRMGLGEMHRSASKAAFVAALRRLIPSIRPSDLKPGRSGVRAQAVSPDGQLIDDFLIEESDHAIHVLNAPSPAATASIAIADHIIDRFAG